jgi:acyl-CoA dehydrogenase
LVWRSDTVWDAAPLAEITSQLAENRSDEKMSDVQEPVVDEGAVRTVTRFVREVVEPAVARADDSGRVPDELLSTASALGLLGPRLPSHYGGAGLSYSASAWVAEMLGYGCAGIQASLYCNHLAIEALLLAGSESQKTRWLGHLGSGPCLASFCATEPGAGSDLGALTTKVERDGAGWVLHGEKAWITHARRADFYVVLATASRADRHRGIGAFLVAAGTPGIVPLPAEMKLGQRACETGGVRFDDVRLTPDSVLAPPGRGFALAMAVFDRTRPDVAAAATGLVQRCLDQSVAESNRRQAFGRPLGELGQIQSLLADMAVSAEASRLLYQKAARLLDEGKDVTLAASLAKLHASTAAVKAALDAIQIHGALGICTGGPTEKLLRDAKVFEIYEGTTQVQKAIIARTLRRPS